MRRSDSLENVKRGLISTSIGLTPSGALDWVEMEMLVAFSGDSVCTAILIKLGKASRVEARELSLIFVAELKLYVPSKTLHTPMTSTQRR